MFKPRLPWCVGALVGLVGCGDVALVFQKGPSKSGTIAVTADDSRVIMVNPERGSVSVFDTATDTRIAELSVGGEPAAVVIHPDDRHAYVAVRLGSQVVELTDLDGTPRIGRTIEVGAEPTGVALSPTGRQLYVAEWAEGRVAVIDTARMAERAAIDEPDHPRGLAVTNDGDDDDDDELIVVPEFFGEPTGVEGTDTSRVGRIRLYRAGDLGAEPSITFAPLDSGFAVSDAPAGAPTVMTSPNQLWTAHVVGARVYVPAIAASPNRPTNFQTNVQPVVLVGDLVGKTDDRSTRGTVNLARLVRDQLPAATPKFFLADLVDLGFVGDDTAYVLSRGADVVQRVNFAGAGPILGSPFNPQIDVNRTPNGSPAPCHNPTGIAVDHAGGRAYLNCWGTRVLGVVDLSTQALIKTTVAAEIASSERAVQDGRHLFFTGRGRWSRDAWSSCASCHPDGLSDNVTWIFAAGPRQSTSVDGSYSHGPGAQQRRVFNWTGIFDEMHDFERNTRDVQGGKGAVTQAPVGGVCGDPATEVPIAISKAGLGRAVKADQDSPTSCARDWDKLDAYGRSVRPPSALRKLDAASVERGRALFGEPIAGANNAGCVRCHGGAGWTTSRVFFTPAIAPAANEPTDLQAIAATPFTPPAAWPPATTSAGWNFHTRTLAAQPASSLFSPAEPAQAPAQVACVLRNVGTFGDDALETRLVKAADGSVNPVARAQGRLGYNVPSLYGMSLGAPYLHHGKARDLGDLFDNPAWAAHATAGNPVWLSSGTADEIAGRKRDLINFLVSIDATTTEQAVPAGFDGCP